MQAYTYFNYIKEQNNLPKSFIERYLSVCELLKSLIMIDFVAESIRPNEINLSAWYLKH